jgi:uncharacterized protein (DUF58 family)
VSTIDPRVHVDLAHLRSLEGAARGLNFLPLQPAQSVLNGRHRSRLRGRGLNFEEMRVYQRGDDVRAIDWKATARTGTPHVRVFTEERDRPALLVIDQRMSMFFGSVLNMKSVTAAEAAALVAFAVLAQGDRVGGIVFDDERAVEVAPRRSRRALFELLTRTADMNQALHADLNVSQRPGLLNQVLGNVARMGGHDQLIVLFSDMSGLDATTRRRVASLAAHNDLVLVLTYDPSARNLAARQPLVVGTGERQVEADFSTPQFREAFAGFYSQRLDAILHWQQEINLNVLPLSAGEPTLNQLRRLLGARAAARSSR